VLFVDQRALSSETVPEQSNFLLRDVNSPRLLLSIASTTLSLWEGIWQAEVAVLCPGHQTRFARSIVLAARARREGNRVFRLIKLPTMFVNAEPDGHAVRTSKGDPRITRVGRLIRMTHRDEMP
jgi:hypothetical protein